jgi:hypothetical protein
MREEAEDKQMEEWFLNSELEKTGTSSESKSEKLAKIALAMNRPNEAIKFLKKNELIAEIQLLQGQPEQALQTAASCNRLFKERMQIEKRDKKDIDTKGILSILSLKVGAKETAEGTFFRDK